jgi:hypothetical protein
MIVGDGRAMRRAVSFLLLLLVAAPATARERIGQYAGWGAFRDEEPARCFAIARPLWRKKHDPSFADITATPGGGPRQFHVRLSRTPRVGEPVTLAIGDRQFTLLVRGSDAWGRNAREDGRIIAAARGGKQMVVTARRTNGRRFRDFYALAGAASAIDAVTVACLQPRR